MEQWLQSALCRCQVCLIGASAGISCEPSEPIVKEGVLSGISSTSVIVAVRLWHCDIITKLVACFFNTMQFVCRDGLCYQTFSAEKNKMYEKGS
jgi:hypothetical protein